MQKINLSPLPSEGDALANSKETSAPMSIQIEKRANQAKLNKKISYLDKQSNICVKPQNFSLLMKGLEDHKQYKSGEIKIVEEANFVEKVPKNEKVKLYN